MRCYGIRFSILGIVCLVVSPLYGAEQKASIEFNRDVRPILSENCFVCHGPGKEDRKVDLRLDLREVAFERKAIVPGNPAQSKLVQHVFATDPKQIMPPPESNKKLSTADKEKLRDWIAAGAKYQPYWAYVKPRRTNPPPTKLSGWVRNPIDAFILQRIEEKGLKPSAEADKAALLRRLSLDLVGLPPTAEEVAAFVSDAAPDRYEKQVERLLSSPHFGERMAVPWLDVVRFADTVGYHGDQNVNIFPYRDYVIASFNRNKPFDQFTIEQLAGDLLPEPTTEARVATGFNRLNMMTREGGAQDKEYLAKYAADRVRTVSMTWLGSTMGCAECHDHKYDPFTSKDFYQMEAFFADIKQWGVYQDYDYTPNPELKGIGNDGPWPPEIEVNSEYLEHRIKSLKSRQDELITKAAAMLLADGARKKSFNDWRQSSVTFLSKYPDGWATPIPAVAIQSDKAVSSDPTNFTVQADGAVILRKGPRKNVQFKLPLEQQSIAAIRLKVAVHEKSDEKNGSSQPYEGASIGLSASVQSGDQTTKLPFADSDADHRKERYANGFPIIGVTDRWILSSTNGQQTAVWLVEKPVEVKSGDTLIVDFGSLEVSSAQISVSPFASLDPLESGMSNVLKEALEKESGGSDATNATNGIVARIFLVSTISEDEDLRKARNVQHEIEECRHGRAFTMVTLARDEPRVTRLLHRGDWQDETGEVLQPNVPYFLPQISHEEGRRLSRLDLARWLISSENPLTARAVMNRLWKQFFGTGISAVVDDLGGQGEWPSHLELLDWLACEFMHPEFTAGESAAPHDWDLKHMVRLMVNSAAYRQSSRESPELKEIDPNNRLLARQSAKRLEAEFVRDNALAISGLLNDELGGPSLHPYQPAGYYANLQFPDRDYYPEPDQRQYRRGVYMHWQRTFVHPMLANFDAPSREECMASRVVSNTPQQALTLLNDPTFVEAARVWAARLLHLPAESDEKRLDRAFHRALGRSPTAQERDSLLEFLSVQRATEAQNPDNAGKLLHVGQAPMPSDEKPAELGAWTQLCRVILNLGETITCY